MQFLLLLALLPALAVGIANFANCDGDLNLGCLGDAECTVPGAKCATNAAGAAPVNAIGCCVAPATTTVATTARTTTRAAVTCVDKLNPVTGVSDCPARAYLCNNAVYLQVMRDQCPRTCNFCSSTGTGTGVGTGTGTGTMARCVDLVNPRTNISDCPTMRAYCTNPVYVSLMRVQCPATCGFCTSG